MEKRSSLIILAILGMAAVLAAGCTQAPAGQGTTPTVTPAVTATTGAQIPNPAAVFCVQQTGNKYEIRTNPDGSQSGVCILPNGTLCDEWAYYRGTCPPATTPAGR